MAEPPAGVGWKQRPLEGLAQLAKAGLAAGLATGETSAADVQNYMLGKLGETLKP